ncbi:MAG TPA: hypothetical protein VF158_17485 [Longimicrobiales bacterium]
MSERRPARGIVLGHGALAEGLVDAARRICDIGEDVLVPLSNRGLSPERLEQEIEARLGAGPVVVFTDLPSGSCSFAARRLCTGRPDLAVIGGVNLPLLLDFVMHRDLPVPELARRLTEKGRAGIVCVPTEFGDHARSTVSGR